MAANRATEARGSGDVLHGTAHPLPDLDTRGRIHDLVVDFYREIAFDDLLGPVFGEVAEVDWSTHIPKLIDYWCRVLLGQPGYDGYILGAHQDVHELEAFRGELFDRWYRLFVTSVDEGWRGPIAEKAKSHAAQIAKVLARRIIGLDWQVPHPDVSGEIVGSCPYPR
jgi:hemoglobin